MNAAPTILPASWANTYIKPAKKNEVTLFKNIKKQHGFSPKIMENKFSLWIFLKIHSHKTNNFKIVFLL